MILLLPKNSPYRKESRKAILLFTLSIFLFSELLRGQTIIDPCPWLHLDKTEYASGDTIKVSFHLKTLEVMYHNGGGCGGGVYWVLICHTDSLKSITGHKMCTLGVPKFFYQDRGNFELKIHNPGTYSIQAYVKKKTETAYDPSHPARAMIPGGDNRMKRMITSPKFEVR